MASPLKGWLGSRNPDQDKILQGSIFHKITELTLLYPGEPGNKNRIVVESKLSMTDIKKAPT
jgi:hypothetical protein